MPTKYGKRWLVVIASSGRTLTTVRCASCKTFDMAAPLQQREGSSLSAL
jgi:LSD1 subclass zinc finger protein